MGGACFGSNRLRLTVDMLPADVDIYFAGVVDRNGGLVSV